MIVEAPGPDCYDAASISGVRQDLPIQLEKDRGVIIEATLGAIDERWHLARGDFAGGSLWTSDRKIPLGQHIRLRVLARDVSLATSQPTPSSIQNILQGRIESMVDDDHPGLALVRVAVGQSLFLARVTQRSVADLALAVGQEVWLQVKSVALME